MKNKDKLMIIPYLGCFYPFYVLFKDGNRTFNLTNGEYVVCLFIQSISILIPIVLLVV